MMPMKQNENIDEVLCSLIGHRVTMIIDYLKDGKVRELYGILDSVGQNVIRVKVVDSWGRWSDYFLNRHTSALLAVCDEDKEDES